MRLLTPAFVTHWHGRMLNIHPALLPSFKGLDTHERAIAEGVKIHGATVHFVVPEMDSGPIIAQAAVPVLTGDTPQSLAARVIQAEHRIYPLALAMALRRQAQNRGRPMRHRRRLGHRRPAGLADQSQAGLIQTRLSWKAAPPNGAIASAPVSVLIPLPSS